MASIQPVAELLVSDGFIEKIVAVLNCGVLGVRIVAAKAIYELGFNIKTRKDIGEFGFQVSVHEMPSALAGTLA